MDTDTVSGTNPHDKLLSRFEKKKVPILVGTQMVTKGLNFENVTLVGVILADQILYCGDYRAEERTFSLITQVVGRSGRGQKKGRAVIQTFTPRNELINLAAKQDYGAFYEREIELRKALGAPPIAELFAINISGMDETAVLKCCLDMKGVLRSVIGNNKNVKLLGPAPAAVVRVSNRYRYRILISAENNRTIRNITANVIIKYLQDSRFRGLSIFADMNPLD
jgi:primosomal protein N' (replication factor Y)